VLRKPAIGTFAITTSIILTTGLIIISLVLDLRSLYLISCTASVSTMNWSGLNSKSRRLKFRDYIFNALEVADDFNIKSAAKIVWLGGKPSVEYFTKKKETPGI
jgi:hypothetical protein